jgi:hypothetical protein
MTSINSTININGTYTKNSNLLPPHQHHICVRSMSIRHPTPEVNHRIQLRLRRPKHAAFRGILPFCSELAITDGVHPCGAG